MRNDPAEEKVNPSLLPTLEGSPFSHSSLFPTLFVKIPFLILLSADEIPEFDRSGVPFFSQANCKLQFDTIFL